MKHAGRLDRIERPRLVSRLAGATASRVAVLIGPAGCGKGDAVRTLRRSQKTIHYRVGKNRATFARFVHGLAEAIAGVAPGAVASFPRAWERALQSRSPSLVLARWLCEHLNGSDGHIIIDDFHDAGGDPNIASFIGAIVELRPDAPLTIAARSVGALPVALWMATGRMQRPIDETELRFNRAEIVQAAEQFLVPLDAAEIAALHSATCGSPIAVAYALTRLRCQPGELRDIMAMPKSFADIAARIFARRNERERRFLFTAALCSSVDDDLLARSGWHDARAVRDALRDDAAFIWERNPAGGFRFHDRFREYLTQQFARLEPALRTNIALTVVESLALAGRYPAALEVATAHRLTVKTGELLDAHGFAIVEAGEVDVISEALAAFADAEQALGASALALRGYIAARSGYLDTGEAWFRLALDAAKDEATQVTIAMYYARELMLQRREDACEILKPFADSATLPGTVARSVVIDVRSAFAQALTAADQLDEARRRTDETVALLEADSPAALRARVLARAAYVALQSGTIELARERASTAAPLAIAQSLYDVAASAYSVLYNIACDIDDDAGSCMEYLHRMRDLGAKSGTLRLDVYVMLALYELHAEAGDENALSALEHSLASADKHDATSEIMEALLPAKSLQAGWSGHFNDAQRLLRPSADRQATPARIAVRWAQIALYCAADRDPAAAVVAGRKADDALARCDTVRTQYGLTLLTLALADIVSGKLDAARRRMAAAGDAVIGAAPRLRALRAAVEALMDGSDGADRFGETVPAALTRLWRASFGGMAKLIEALPQPAQRRGAAETIGSALAKRELTARFAMALQCADARPLCAWLDSLSGATFQGAGLGAGLTERFERWAARADSSDRQTRATLAKLRRELTAYRRPAPAQSRQLDDVDASIDELFEQLNPAVPQAHHARAVSAWCGRIGRVLALSEADVAFVTRCGLLHDAGELRAPAVLVEAARPLTPEEWVIVREHSAEGARIVGAVAQLRAFVPIVRGHHERVDGRGYPDGLRSTAIPLAARIVAVADAFNAMIERRPYRLPLAPTEALGELQRGRGTQFDPEIVDAMVMVVLGRPVEAQPASA